ncbi:hypothetical protein C8R42DRAFT_641753 [Lentinula raphanica]|nr:hypothetical protein C8R42DRAFT_641753 [Lentinula raphanica]
MPPSITNSSLSGPSPHSESIPVVQNPDSDASNTGNVLSGTGPTKSSAQIPDRKLLRRKNHQAHRISIDSGLTVAISSLSGRYFQPYTVGFLVPSVATYVLVQRYSPGKSHESRIFRAAVDITILAGTFICTFILWSLISFMGDVGAMVLLAFSFGTRYLSVLGNINV